MDWKTIVQRQADLEASFAGLRQVFEQAERDFKHKNNVLLEKMGQMQAQDAANLARIHQALQLILESNNTVKQNPPQ